MRLVESLLLKFHVHKKGGLIYSGIVEWKKGNHAVFRDVGNVYRCTCEGCKETFFEKDTNVLNSLKF